MNLFSLFITSLLTQNIVLTKFLGICPFIGTSSKSKSALSMGLCVTFVITCSSIITFLIYNYVLVPTNTVYLKTVFFILVIAAFVQMLVILLKKYNKELYKSFGIYLPLITTNCAVLGVTLININSNFNFLEMLVYSVSSSLGFTLVIYIFSTIREKIYKVNLGRLNGVPIAFITAAIMTLIFARYV